VPDTVSLIGIDAVELRWLRLLVGLLRHPDPTIPELARQALLYLADAAGRAELPANSPRQPRGSAG
jgi:hypothetical protein